MTLLHCRVLYARKDEQIQAHNGKHIHPDPEPLSAWKPVCVNRNDVHEEYGVVKQHQETPNLPEYRGTYFQLISLKQAEDEPDSLHSSEAPPRASKTSSCCKARMVVNTEPALLMPSGITEDLGCLTEEELNLGWSLFAEHENSVSSHLPYPVITAPPPAARF